MDEDKSDKSVETNYGEEAVADREIVIAGEEGYKTLHRAIPQRNLLWDGEAAYSGDSLTQREKGRLTRKIETIEAGRFKEFNYDPITKEYKPYMIDLTSLNIGELPEILLNHRHINYLDLMYNKINDAGLEDLIHLEYLVTLILDHNKVKSTTLPLMPNLMYLSMKKNYIRTINKFNQPRLKYVFLDENKIQYVSNVDSKSLPLVHIISISHCELLSMNANYSTTLRKLFLCYNQIQRIDGISRLPNLKWLSLRGNEIENITGLSSALAKLYYVNLRENEISEEDQLEKFRVLPKLRILILTGNPLDQGLGKALRGMILKINPDMRRINKYLVDPEEEEEARRLIAEERERLMGEFGEEMGDEAGYGEDY